MRITAIMLAWVVVAGSSGFAQQKPQNTPPSPQDKPPAAASTPSQGKPLVPLKVQIVLSRFKGDKKIGSLPYVLGVAANDGGWTNLRMGIDVPIARKGENPPMPASAISYRSVGTNLDCMAESVSGDSYRLVVRVEDTSVLAEAGDTASKNAAQPTAIAGDMPAFRSFKSNFTLVLRDGQTVQYTSAVDPISGEVMKVDVTINVLK